MEESIIIGSWRRFHSPWVQTPVPFPLGPVAWPKRQVSPSGTRAWVTPSAAQAPCVHRDVPSPQAGSPSATCAQGCAKHWGYSLSATWTLGLPSTQAGSLSAQGWADRQVVVARGAASRRGLSSARAWQPSVRCLQPPWALLQPNV